MKRRRAPGHALPLTCLLSTSGETAPATRHLITATCLNRSTCPRPTGLEHVHLCYKTLLLWAWVVLWSLSQQWICFSVAFQMPARTHVDSFPLFTVNFFWMFKHCQIMFDWIAEQTLSRCLAQHSGAKAQGRCLYREGWRLDRVKDQRLDAVCAEFRWKDRLITQAAAKADWALTERETSELISALQCVCVWPLTPIPASTIPMHGDNEEWVKLSLGKSQICLPGFAYSCSG